MKKACTALLVLGLAVSVQAMGRVRAQEAQRDSKGADQAVTCCAPAPEAKEAAGCGTDAESAHGTAAKASCGTARACGSCATAEQAPAQAPDGCCGGH